MKYSIIFAVLICLLECSAQQTSEKKIVATKTIYPVKNDSIQYDSSNTLAINKSCAIIMWPDSNELKEINKNDTDAYQYFDDVEIHTIYAENLLDSLKIENIRCDKKFIILKNRDNHITRYKKESVGGIILFNIDKEPIIILERTPDTALILKYFAK
jgi:hypothetical protein